MKSLKKVALAAAVACVAAGNAFAVVNLNTGADPVYYAKELVTAGATISGAGLNIETALGFGVSNGQTRYIRIDLGNAVFAANKVDASLTVDAGGTPATVTLADKGQIDDSYVIYQITANAAGHPSADLVEFALGTGGVKVTSPNSSVTVTYSLYETAADAVNGTGAGRLAVQSNKTAAGIVKSTGLSVDAKSAIAEVTDGYQSFTAATDQDVPEEALVGVLTLGLVDPDGTGPQTVTKTLAGVDVTLANLYGVGSKIVIATNQTLASVSDVFVSGDATCGGSTMSDVNANRTATTTEIAVDANGIAGLGLCYLATGTTAIAAQDFTISSVNTAGTLGTAANESSQALGSFTRNGTILKAAFADAGISGFGNSIHLSNTSGTAATYTTSCLTETGRVAGLGGSVPANSGIRRGVNSGSGFGCPAGTRGVELTMAVPSGTVIGSVVRQNVTTGQAAFDGMVGNQ